MTIKELKLELAERIAACQVYKKQEVKNTRYIFAEYWKNQEDAYKSIMELLNKGDSNK